jgi:HSP20 family molecular chaperone IbpA
VVIQVTGSEDWEKQVLEQMVEMFKNMGLDVDADDLRLMMEQIQSQFDKMGVDPEKIASGDVKINLQSDFGDLSKLFGEGGLDLSEMLSNMGVDVRMGTEKEAPVVEAPVVEAPVVEAPDEDDAAVTVIVIPSADVYIEDNSMSITIDISSHENIDSSDLELNLSSSGSTLELSEFTKLQPFKSYTLPQSADAIKTWELNNGILDITLTLRESETSASE